MSTFATDKFSSSLSSLSGGRCGNCEPGKFSLPVLALEMFVLRRYTLAISAGEFVLII